MALDQVAQNLETMLMILQAIAPCLQFLEESQKMMELSTLEKVSQIQVILGLLQPILAY